MCLSSSSSHPQRALQDARSHSSHSSLCRRAVPAGGRRADSTARRNALPQARAAIAIPPLGGLLFSVSSRRFPFPASPPLSAPRRVTLGSRAPSSALAAPSIAHTSKSSSTYTATQPDSSRREERSGRGRLVAPASPVPPHPQSSFGGPSVAHESLAVAPHHTTRPSPCLPSTVQRLNPLPGVHHCVARW